MMAQVTISDHTTALASLKKVAAQEASRCLPRPALPSRPRRLS